MLAGLVKQKALAAYEAEEAKYPIALKMMGHGYEEECLNAALETVLGSLFKALEDEQDKIDRECSYDFASGFAEARELIGTLLIEAEPEGPAP